MLPCFAYLVQWSAFIIQERREPCVMPIVCAPQGSVKSAIFGHNQTCPGPYMCIFGTYAYKLNDIEQLTQKHNTAGMGKLYCVLEEASPYRRAHRASDKLKDIIDSEIQRIEPKGVDDFEVSDHRAFVGMTNNEDAFPGEQGNRRYLALRSDPHFSKPSVDNGRVPEEERDAFCAKFDKLKNDDELAYKFFEYCMLLDLGDSKLHLPPRTEMLKDMQKHIECALRSFLAAVKSGEWGSGTFTPRSETDEEANQRANNELAELNAHELYEKFRTWAKATDAETSITTKVSLGIALKKYT